MAEIVLITNKKDIKSIVVREFLSVEEVIKKLNQSTRQIAIVANKKNRLIGTITDGDIRRGLLRKGLSLSSSIKSIINLSNFILLLCTFFSNSFKLGYVKTFFSVFKMALTEDDIL